MGSKLGLRYLQEICQIDPGSVIGIVTIDDRGDTRSAYDAFQTFASRTNIKLLVARTRKESEEIVRELKPQICIVSGWYWLISAETLDTVPYGFLAIHNSLLPKYRGGSPLVWAIINGDPVTGFSLFSLSKGMDDGDIWAQESVTIEETDYISDIIAKIQNRALSVIREKYLDILNGRLKALPQAHEHATYCAQRTPADGLIDWENSARAVYNFIRAQSDPYPGAFTYHGGSRLTVWRAQPEDVAYYGTPGQVARISNKGVHVICGDNKPIVLEEVSLNGKRGHASRFIDSIKVRFPSSRFPVGQLPSEGGFESERRKGGQQASGHDGAAREPR